MLLYLAEGAIGLPVFAGGASGAARLVGPTGGYLWALVIAAYLVGSLCKSRRGWPKVFLAFLLGDLVILVLGSAWLAHFTGVSAALGKGFLPFIPGDVLKAALASSVLPWVRQRTERSLPTA